MFLVRSINMLPTVVASCVVRSTYQGESHGGIMRVNLETEEVVKMLDWNNPDINWCGRGGDRGVRGLAFFGHTLYALAGNELFAFEQDGEDGNQLVQVASYSSYYLFGTHEMWRHKEKLYLCSGEKDTILVFDLVSKRWIKSYYHNKDSMGLKSFDPNTGKGYQNVTSGFIHTDSVYADDNFMWYCGSYSDGLWRLDLNSGQSIKIQLQIADTHNARPYRGGYLYNLCPQSKTIFERGGKIIKEWLTPQYDLSTLTHTNLPCDHARAGYTRGMVTYGDFVIVGTSPATVNVYDVNKDGNLPIKSVQLSKDLRNSICGMALYEW